eukprot:TRINITY_DN2924_c0_g4_i1.p3 TRINITY_DN2924_c0_g4~~TRINITY_DN2924_c0_g4_i1.p3  ORF type:complete len:68 (-),score=9.86 TRINITY_DN2924_c0_g4_i1:28-231(-)
MGEAVWDWLAQRRGTNTLGWRQNVVTWILDKGMETLLELRKSVDAGEELLDEADQVFPACEVTARKD